MVATFGQTFGRDPQRQFGQKVSDRRLHTVAFGQTGTGKTTILRQLARQDCLADRGFGLLDPHGDLAQFIAAECKPDIYWDVANPDCPYGYNPLTFVAPAYRPLVASGLIDAFKKQWADAWGNRMEHLLRFALLTLLERPNSSLSDIMPLFLDKGFRAEVIANVTDPQLLHFWEVEYTAMNFKNAADGVAPIANKLGAFLAHPLVRRAVCEPEKPLRLRSIMDEGQTLVVNLAKGRLGGDIANVLGGLIVSSLAQAAYSRANQPEAERKDWILYLDEFQSFTTAAFADMLSELRKYRVGLVCTTQFSSGLDQNVLEAILGNVGTLIAFRVGATDAAILARQFGNDVPSASDLVGLPNFEMYVKLMVDGQQTKPFSARTLSPQKTLVANSRLAA